MTLKKIKLLKIERILLASCYLYLLSLRNEINSTSYIIVTGIILFCALIIGSIIPENKRVGNTFLTEKYRWVEQCLEIIIMLFLSWILYKF